MGAPQFAVPALERLVGLGAEIVAVYTKAPKPAGRRGLELTRTAVHEMAESFGLRVLTPAMLRNAEAIEQLRSLQADVAIVAAYGLILPTEALSAPAYGCLNLHGSLLPRWRGAAPIQRAIMAGDAVTGVGLMRMETGLDTGPVARELSVPISPQDTAGDLASRLADLAADLLQQSWAEIVDRRLSFHAQSEEGVSYARKIEKTEAVINWRADAVTIRNRIHGLSPAPGAYSEISLAGQTERIKFLRVEVAEGEGEPGALIGPDFRVACGQGAIRALEVQRAGKAPAKAIDVLRGGRPRVGDRFNPLGAPASVSQSGA
jgi:methionyl-tRNA formyltransferase